VTPKSDIAIAKHRAKVEAMNDEELRAYVHGRLHRRCDARIAKLEAALEHIASMAGAPDAAKACRNIIKRARAALEGR
jgi:hypothetical protein